MNHHSDVDCIAIGRCELQMRPARGFSLIELVIVVLILGILAGVAAPSYFTSSKTAEINAMMAERNAILTAIELCVIDTGNFPGDQMGGDFPPELAPYLKASVFTVNRPLTGTWDWSLSEFGFQASLSLVDWTADLDVWAEIDALYDDNDVDTGGIRTIAAYGGHFLVFIVQE